jgi:Family of unknown function (DUF5681)
MMTDELSVKSVRKASMRRPHNWKPGQSGNPKGMPKGSKHKATIFAEQLFQGESEELVRRVIELAKAGDPACLKLCLERILPPLKSRLVHFKLPTIRTLGDALNALTSLVEGISTGALLPEDGESLLTAITTFARVIETAGLEEKLNQLEAARAEAEKDKEHYRYDA